MPLALLDATYDDGLATAPANLTREPGECGSPYRSDISTAIPPDHELRTPASARRYVAE